MEDKRMELLGKIGKDIEFIAENNMKEAKRTGKHVIDKVILDEFERVMTASFTPLANLMSQKIFIDYNFDADTDIKPKQVAKPVVEKTVELTKPENVQGSYRTMSADQIKRQYREIAEKNKNKGE